MSKMSKMSKMFVKQKMVVFNDTPKCRSSLKILKTLCSAGLQSVGVGAAVNGSVVVPSVPDGDLNLSLIARELHRLFCTISLQSVGVV